MVNQFYTGIRKNLLFLILFTATLIGLLYIFLVPPWQHYDEPGHFEYAWLAANQENWPKPGDYDLSMRREVAASMIEHNFYNPDSGTPNLISLEPVYIGISQLEDMPFYYFLASLPLRLVRFSDITFQLYVVRFVSLIFFVLTIFWAYLACRYLFPEGSPLRWMIPVFIACLPPFVDLMTAANNDVAVTAFSTFTLWACIRLLTRGLSVGNVALVLLGSALSFLSKNTGFLIVVFGLMSILLSIFIKKPVLGWLCVTVIAILGVLGVFNWNIWTPAFFYAQDYNFLPKRIADPQVPLGKYIISQSAQMNPKNGFYFFVPSQILRGLQGKTITVGVWAWANEAVTLTSPVLQIYQGGQSGSGELNLGKEPVFHTFVYQIPESAALGWVWVYASKEPGKSVMWDGWVLAEGDRSELPPPTMADPLGKEGVWGDTAFHNPIKNGSGEVGWPFLRSSVGQTLNMIRGVPGPYLWSWVDWDGVGWYYRASIPQLFRTFWGKFSWAQVTLSGRKPFWVFIGFSLLAVLGIVIKSSRLNRQKNWSVFLFLAVICLVQIVVVVFRGNGSWINRIYIPVARYAYPVTFPMVLFLCLGWYSLVDFFPIQLRRRHLPGILFLALLVIYNCWAISSIYYYFARG